MAARRASRSYPRSRSAGSCRSAGCRKARSPQRKIAWLETFSGSCARRQKQARRSEEKIQWWWKIVDAAITARHCGKEEESLRAHRACADRRPMASNSVTRCLRAPSSFHLRSRLTISSNAVERAFSIALHRAQAQGRSAPDGRWDWSQALRRGWQCRQCPARARGARVRPRRPNGFVACAIGTHKLQRLLRPLTSPVLR